MKQVAACNTGVTAHTPSRSMLPLQLPTGPYTQRHAQFLEGGESGTVSGSAWLVAVGAAAGAACRSVAAPFCSSCRLLPPACSAALAAASRDLRALNF